LRDVQEYEGAATLLDTKQYSWTNICS